MFKALIAIGLVAIAIAFGVQQLAHKGVSTGPTVVTVKMPNPIGGGGGGGGNDGGGGIYVP